MVQNAVVQIPTHNILFFSIRFLWSQTTHTLRRILTQKHQREAEESSLKEIEGQQLEKPTHSRKEGYKQPQKTDLRRIRSTVKPTLAREEAQ